MNGNKRKIINVGWGSERDIEIEMEVKTEIHERERVTESHTNKGEKRERDKIFGL